MYLSADVRSMIDDIDGPRDYDREFLSPVRGPVRRRVGIDVDRGGVVRFVVQLESHHDGEWHPVVRYDHDGGGGAEHAHDVTDEGLHIDIYRKDGTVATEFVTPSRTAGEALDLAAEPLTGTLERFIRRYEEWHGIDR